MSKGFSIFLRIFFGAVIVIAVLVFAGVIPQPSDPAEQGQVTGTITIWGTFPERQMSQLIKQFYPENKVSYVQRRQENFDAELVEAIAGGTGPDLVLIPQELILKRKESLQLIPFDVLSERQFKDAFLQQGEIYLEEEGALALPFYIDPMVMYWNRELFSQAGLVEPPQYWDQMYDVVPKLAKRTEDGTITQSALAFGEFRNVTHAKDLISMLILQRGNPIIASSTGGQPISVISGDTQRGIPSADSVLSFYTRFSDPTREQYYTWNRGLNNSKSRFVNKNLAMYFGYASEYRNLERTNPLLDFDVAQVPQIRDNSFEATNGKIFGVSLLESSDNQSSAYNVALTLASNQFSQALSNATFLPPVRRGLHGDRPNDAFRTVFYDSAIISRGWRDPNPEETSRIFRQAVEGIVSGEVDAARAARTMDEELQVLLEQTLSLRSGGLARQLARTVQSP